MGTFSESVVEEAALAWLESLGYAIKHLPAPQDDASRLAGGPDISPSGDTLTPSPSPSGIGKAFGVLRGLLQKTQQFESGAICKNCISF